MPTRDTTAVLTPRDLDDAHDEVWRGTTPGDSPMCSAYHLGKQRAATIAREELAECTDTAISYDRIHAATRETIATASDEDTPEHAAGVVDGADHFEAALTTRLGLNQYE